MNRAKIVWNSYIAAFAARQLQIDIEGSLVIEYTGEITLKKNL